MQHRDEDKFGRTPDYWFGEVEWFNKLLTEPGRAWHYKLYSADAELARAADEARRKPVGLWSRPNPVPPWDYRHRSESNRGAKAATPTPPLQAPNPSAGAPDAMPTVWITSRGAKYHLPGCK